MAHELLIENGEAAMMYVGQVPWHDLGTRLETAPKTAAEAMKVAKLDWDVGLKRVYAWEGEHFYEIPDRKAVVRWIIGASSIANRSVWSATIITFFRIRRLSASLTKWRS